MGKRKRLVQTASLTVPEGTPLRKYCQLVVGRPLSESHAYKVEIGAFGRFLTGMSPKEFDRYVQTDRQTAGRREMTPEQERKFEKRKFDKPWESFDLRRACLYSIRSIDGEDVEKPDTAAYDDSNIETWVDDLEVGAVRQLGTWVLEISGMRDTPAAQGNE